MLGSIVANVWNHSGRAQLVCFRLEAAIFNLKECATSKDSEERRLCLYGVDNLHNHSPHFVKKAQRICR